MVGVGVKESPSKYFLSVFLGFPLFDSRNNYECTIECVMFRRIIPSPMYPDTGFYTVVRGRLIVTSVVPHLPRLITWDRVRHLWEKGLTLNDGNDEPVRFLVSDLFSFRFTIKNKMFLIRCVFVTGFFVSTGRLTG